MTSENTDSEPEPEDAFETVATLQAPPGLARIISKDDISIVPDHEKKAKKNAYAHALTPNPTSNARKKKRKKLAETNPKILELEANIRALTRDNRVLQRKLEKVESSTGKKQKKMDNEREMRLAANKERYTLKQKLEKLQKAIAVRLKLLGVDFSKIDDITTALDTCFNVIRKLVKELQEKEEQLQDTKSQLTQATSELSASNKVKKQVNALTELNKSCMDNQATLYHEIDELKANILALQEEKTVFKIDLEAKALELERLSHENEALAKQKEELMRNKNDFEMQFNKSAETVQTLQSELEHMKTKQDELHTNLLNEHDAKWKNKCQEYDALNEKYKMVKAQSKSEAEKVRLQQNEYEASIQSLRNKLNALQNTKKEVKEKEVTYKHTITALHEEIEEKDKVIKSQKKKVKALQKELDVSGFGDNKKFSQMSLLKKNVENMHNIIRDKDNQIKTLTNKLNQRK